MVKKILEASRDNGGFSTSQTAPTPSLNTGVTSSKGKAKGVFTTFNHSDPESDDDLITRVTVAAGHSDWIKPGSNYKFPCLLQNHDHEIAACLASSHSLQRNDGIKFPRDEFAIHV